MRQSTTVANIAGVGRPAALPELTLRQPAGPGCLHESHLVAVMPPIPAAPLTLLPPLLLVGQR